LRFAFGVERSATVHNSICLTYPHSIMLYRLIITDIAIATLTLCISGIIFEIS
jgi:hypothetical protein